MIIKMIRAYAYSVLVLASYASLALVSYASVSRAEPAAEENHFNTRISFESELTDNASKRNLASTITESDKVKERVDIYSINVGTFFQNDWALLNADYDARRENYSKASYPDSSTFEGTTAVTFGSQHQSASLLLSHSRQSLLTAPDAVDLVSNRDERDIVKAQPMLKLRLGNADSFFLKGSIAKVDYSEIETKNSERTGGELGWERGLNKTDKLLILLQKSTTKFEAFPLANYGYESATAIYSVQLSRLSYTLQAGQNRATREQSVKSYARPSYNLEASYTYGDSQFSLAASQEITDSSSGNGNRTALTEVGRSSAGVGLDIINLRSVELAWQGKILCQDCTVSVNAIETLEDYQELDEDGKEQMLGANFGYRFSNAASINVRIDHRKRLFFDSNSRGDFSANRARINYSYNFSTEFGASLYAQSEKRKALGFSQNLSTNRDYDENIIGLGLSYRF
jgi:hypothetical protein